jgi:hypothetical protein
LTQIDVRSALLPRSGVILMVGNCRRRLLEGFETVSWAPTLT